MAWITWLKQKSLKLYIWLLAGCAPKGTSASSFLDHKPQLLFPSEPPFFDFHEPSLKRKKEYNDSPAPLFYCYYI